MPERCHWSPPTSAPAVHSPKGDGRGKAGALQPRVVWPVASQQEGDSCKLHALSLPHLAVNNYPNKCFGPQVILTGLELHSLITHTQLYGDIDTEHLFPVNRKSSAMIAPPTFAS